MSAPAPPPTLEEVREIAALRNPVVRNLAITRCYGRLSAAFTQRTGQCANWCTYATWASRQAGRTIRGEDVVETLRARLAVGPQVLHPLESVGRSLLRCGLFNPESRLGRAMALLHSPFDVFEATSAAVARGNQKVFAEIGYEFARFLHEVPPEAGADSPQLRGFVEGLRAGPPPDGQDNIAQAFTGYVRAGAMGDEPARAQLNLLANLRIGEHEQTRLQPEIRESLDAPYVVAHDLDERLVRALGWRRRVPRVVAAPVEAAGGRLQRSLSDMLREIITRSLMVMSLPGRVLYLGQNLDEPFPDALQTLAEADLEALFARFEPAAPAPDRSGALDWSDFAQRMHYIAHLFRAYHFHEELLGPPFTAEQDLAITAGTIPDGDL